MTSGYGDKEREFLSSLETDTGRTLAQWMDAIGAQGLGQRNDIIDWLRRQGFRFSRASWLERVHHNGGRPIYADRPAGDRPVRAPRPPVRPRAESGPRAGAPALGSGAMSALAPRGAATATARADAARPAGEAYSAAAANVMPLQVTDPLSPSITAVTARAKAYRPLADFLLREIAKAVPGVQFSVRGQHIVIARDRELATLAVSARDLRLAISGGDAVTLTDARQVDASLLARVRAAAGTSA